MRALEAKARNDGLDRTADFVAMRFVMEDKLLAEFLQERDHMMPWQIGNDLEGREKAKAYLDRLRSGLRFNAISSSTASNDPPKTVSVETVKPD